MSPGAFDPTAFDPGAFFVGSSSATTSASVSVSVTVGLLAGQYLNSLGQVVSGGSNPGGAANDALILYPETGELEVQDKYSPKVPSRARKTWR